MSESTLTIVGNLTKDPFKRKVQGTYGDRFVAQFSVASSKRVMVDGKWDDGPTTFVDVSCWGKMAENVMTSLEKGMGVIVFGRLDQNRWETEDGQKRSQLRIHATAVGPDLRKGKADVTRNPKEEREPQSQQQEQQQADPHNSAPTETPESLDEKAPSFDNTFTDQGEDPDVEVTDNTELAGAQAA